jgi:hypothetical protein
MIRSGLGALAALKAQNRTDVGVVGIDGLEESLKEIKSGSGQGWLHRYQPIEGFNSGRQSVWTSPITQ